MDFCSFTHSANENIRIDMNIRVVATKPDHFQNIQFAAQINSSHIHECDDQQYRRRHNRRR